MPAARHCRTIDLGMKLSSFLSAPPLHDTDAMDKFTDLELNRLILQEPPLARKDKDKLGYILSLIFQSCTVEVPNAKDLAIPLRKLPSNAGLDHLETFTLKPGGDPMVHLYDSAKRQWNWPLSKQRKREKSDLVQGGGSSMGEKSGDWVLIDEATQSQLSSGSLGVPSTSELTASKLPFADGDLFADEGPEVGEESEVEEGSEVGEMEEDSLEAPSIKAEDPSTTEQIFSSFFNIISVALIASQPKLARAHDLSRTWSAANSSRPVPGEEIPRKPDLTLLDDVEASTYQPSSTLAKTLDTKAYLLLKHQPWRRFALLISVCNSYRDLRVHVYDHSGGVVSPCTSIQKEPNKFLRILSCIVFGNLTCIGSKVPLTHPPTPREIESTPYNEIESAPSCNEIESASSCNEIESTSSQIGNPLSEEGTERAEGDSAEDDFVVELPIEIPQDPTVHEPLPRPIGKIRVKDHYYDILEILFSRQGLVGRGTVCYLARKDGEEFIIKDYWAMGGDEEALNEIHMMEKMSGVLRCPQACRILACRNYRFNPAREPLHKFRTKLELLTSIRDIVQIQKEAVEQRKVLHRDCSLNNSMIEDDGNGSQGMLIDWEFAVKIAKNETYTVGGTGTLPFMSRALLFQLHLKSPGDMVAHKGASSSKPYPAPLIKHSYQDDLESVFYVFIWILIEFRGPLGMKRILDKSCTWIPHEWSASKFKACCDSKTSFFFTKNTTAKELTNQIHPYFKNLLPVALEWHHLIRDPKNVGFDDMISMLNRHIATFPTNELSPQLLVSTWLLKALNKADSEASSSGEEGESESRLVAEPMVRNKNKRVIDYQWTMEAVPKPKRSKTG
ncbi:hypothetical protein DEU56DRAFT_954656 [Suillus clintonianus]|uniref:uncharacterized protein n=1 Tax=Suillus clintonianus TaxID=1904413 RepID=UPI001B86C33E|nr:uncharacterized protein DEU56DRAFT_954656 [Suillus clintonianus]KAG2130741.1 hypothetical protein DEU56DRAFT_954656 [Suillus clintonianus]